jgi:hypothetical protein
MRKPVKPLRIVRPPETVRVVQPRIARAPERVRTVRLRVIREGKAM